LARRSGWRDNIAAREIEVQANAARLEQPKLQARPNPCKFTHCWSQDS
jgi:hypothetical protein